MAAELSPDSTIVVRSPEADVFILLLTFGQDILNPLLFDTGVGNKCHLKKLSALVSNNLHTTGAILVSVIKRPKNRNFLRAISDCTEFSSESFKSNYLGVTLGTKKRFLSSHCWHLSNFSIKVRVTVNSSTPYSKEGR